MNIPPILPYISTVLFGLIAIGISIKEEQLRKKLKKSAVLPSNIPHPLDFEKILNVLTKNLKGLFPYSTASTLIIKSNTLVFSICAEEEISPLYIDNVKKNMLKTLGMLYKNWLPNQIQEFSFGQNPNPANTEQVLSSFDMPLLLDNHLIGILTLTSTKPDAFSSPDLNILEKITNQTITRTQAVKSSTGQDPTLSLLLDTMRDGIFMLDSARNLSLINNSAKSILGIKNPTIDAAAVIDSLKASYTIEAKIQEVISQKKSIEDKGIKLGEKMITVLLNPILDATMQKVSGVTVLVQDKTTEKIMMQQKDDFTHMMVHELRAPLTAIKDASEILTSDGEKYEPAQQLKLLLLIDKQSKRLLDQVSDILDAAKLDAGKFTIDKVATDIAKLIQERIDIFTPEAQTKQLKLISQLNAQLPAVEVDPGRMSQVINNLLSNSFKFTPAGGSITISASIMDKFVKVSVTDTGMGIPKEKQGQLFSKYAQVQQTHNPNDPKPVPKPAGTGLGLYILKGIVEAHGGSIHLESEEGKGTTIWFTIPIPVAQQTQTWLRPETPAAQTQSPSAQ